MVSRRIPGFSSGMALLISSQSTLVNSLLSF